MSFGAVLILIGAILVGALGVLIALGIVPLFPERRQRKPARHTPGPRGPVTASRDAARRSASGSSDMQSPG